MAIPNMTELSNYIFGLPERARVVVTGTYTNFVAALGQADAIVTAEKARLRSQQQSTGTGEKRPRGRPASTATSGTRQRGRPSTTGKFNTIDGMATFIAQHPGQPVSYETLKANCVPSKQRSINLWGRNLVRRGTVIRNPDRSYTQVMPAAAQAAG
jgi:hypothetical protein